jgi:hypothetical protein
MQLPNGAIAYAPWNTYDFLNPALGTRYAIFLFAILPPPPPPLTFAPSPFAPFPS